MDKKVTHMKTRALVVVVAAFAVLGSGPAVAADGAQLFKSRCGICHWDPAQAGEKPRQGPSLKKLIGRTAGTEKSFTRFSPAMKKAGFVWTADKLDAYLDTPRKLVPGTSMAFVGLKKPDERKAVVNYLLKAAR
ncbi:c-type cytochrome [Sphingosinicella soli]|uniref:Cytochrome c n=1 Tax=Sphingosinicella soli TaxID=333708 RepID=A0A7W7F4Q4_9SPHN|nr:c-type cytochrome [Sphingosinicella soli]MBB4630516.1 cytochrome c [Sphingosinicella soli]